MSEPQGIDDLTGFKVPLSKLRRQWDGMRAVNPDKRNPQDFVRGVRDGRPLPFTRPEAADSFMAAPIMHEDGFTPIMTVSGLPILTEGAVAVLP